MDNLKLHVHVRTCPLVRKMFILEYKLCKNCAARQYVILFEDIVQFDVHVIIFIHVRYCTDCRCVTCLLRSSLYHNCVLAGGLCLDVERSSWRLDRAPPSTVQCRCSTCTHSKHRSVAGVLHVDLRHPCLLSVLFCYSFCTPFCSCSFNLVMEQEQAAWILRMLSWGSLTVSKASYFHQCV